MNIHFHELFDSEAIRVFIYNSLLIQWYQQFFVIKGVIFFPDS